MVAGALTDGGGRGREKRGEGCVVGTTLPWRGGLLIALGTSFHKRTVLKGSAVGDAFSGPGDIPTRKVWSGSPGFYVGAAMDSNVFSTLKGLWKDAGK